VKNVEIIETEFVHPNWEKRVEEACKTMTQLLVKYNNQLEKKKKLLTVQDLADQLSVTESTIYSWTHKRLIPFVKLGTRVRFRQDKIDAWLNRRSFNVKKYKIE